MNTRSTIVPVLMYRNAPQAIDWLCDVFGFSRHAVYPAADGSIMHAELTLDGGMIMLSSIKDQASEFGKLVTHPDSIGGLETQSSYLIVPDADVVYRRALAAGATMVIEIRDEDYGGRGFNCKDLEGRLWSIGTYNPWSVSQP